MNSRTHTNHRDIPNSVSHELIQIMSQELSESRTLYVRVS